MIKLYYILLCTILLFGISCTAESLKQQLIQQEQAISDYLLALQNNQDSPATITYSANGVHRATLIQGTGEGAKAKDSLIFTYNAFVFSAGKGGLYALGEEQGTLGTGNYFGGLEEGLTGMSTGEYAQIIIASERAYGNTNLGALPPNTPVIFEIWMTRTVKN